MENKAQLIQNSMNAISGGTVLYEKGDPVNTISLLIKGRVEAAVGGIALSLLAAGDQGIPGVILGAEGDHVLAGLHKLGDLKLELLTELMEELLSGKRVGTVAIGNETKVFRKLFQMLEGHAHRHDAGADPPVV